MDHNQVNCVHISQDVPDVTNWGQHACAFSNNYIWYIVMYTLKTFNN